jgi:hypothetical protein
MNKSLTDLVTRAGSWPDAAQRELADLAAEIEAELNAGLYYPTPEERAGIARGLRDAAAGRYASERDVEAVFARHRKK